MAHAAVIGAGTTGLSTALVLARHGHRITLLEADAAPPPEDPEACFASWARRGVPQARLPHAFAPLGRNLLRERLPDVYSRLLEMGAAEVDMAALMPVEREPSDDLLVALALRRPLMEKALREVLSAEPGVSLRTGATVTGLLLTEDRSNRIGGVALEDVRLSADLVVDASGRRSRTPAWLADLGMAAPADQREPCGLIYYSRYYRLHDERMRPRGPWTFGPGGLFPYFGFVLHRMEGLFFSITLIAPQADRDLRVLAHEEAFGRAAAQIPALGSWLEASTPISDVLPFGALENVLRGFATEGEPVARGLAVLGDARCHTNAAYGWGVSLGLSHAFELAEALAANDPGSRSFALDLESRLDPISRDRYRASAGRDAARLRHWAGVPFNADDQYRFLLQAAGPASLTSPDLHRPLVEAMSLLRPASDVDENDDYLTRAREAWTEAAGHSPAPPAMPDRSRFLELLK